jgi:hypothetical protein
MRMLSFLTRHAPKRRVEKVLSTAQSVGETVGPSTRRAHYDGVLVDPDSLVSRDTLHLITQLRRENAYTSWFAVARYVGGAKWRLAAVKIGVSSSP